MAGASVRAPRYPGGQAEAVVNEVPWAGRAGAPGQDASLGLGLWVVRRETRPFAGPEPQSQRCSWGRAFVQLSACIHVLGAEKEAEVSQGHCQPGPAPLAASNEPWRGAGRAVAESQSEGGRLLPVLRAGAPSLSQSFGRCPGWGSPSTCPAPWYPLPGLPCSCL